MNRKMKEIRIYSECYEQGLYLLEYIKAHKKLIGIKTRIIYTKPALFSNYVASSSVARLFKNKDFDGLISVIDNNGKEDPLLTIEFSSAVPVDDHILQRFDFIYWSTFYKVPSLKISPTKVYNTNFGGGNKIKLSHEYYASLNIKGVYYHAEWPLINESDLAVLNDKFISSPPILDEVTIVFDKLINTYLTSSNQNTFFEKMQSDYKKYILENFEDEGLNFSTSSRYNFDENGNLTLKFNRFGHGMDPERGMLTFWSCKLGYNPIVKFIVQRKNMEDYRKLYEGNRDNEILKMLEKVYNDGNIITKELAFDLFVKSTSTYLLFENCLWNKNKILINDQSLKQYLMRDTSVVNNLLRFGSKVILTDLRENVIVEFNWNEDIVREVYALKSRECGELERIPLPLKNVTNNNLNEDIVTFACQKIFASNNMINIAVSYPGAQGDRKILYGSGTTVKREYLDIISIKKKADKTYNIIIHENKKKLSDTKKSDIEKLYNFRNNEIKMRGLEELISKVYSSITLNKCYLGVGGKKSNVSFSEDNFDYLISIEINDSKEIEWNITSDNKEILEMFKDMQNKNGELKGTMKFEEAINVVE